MTQQVLHGALLDPGDVVADRKHWRLHRGANVRANGVRFSVWAPDAQSMVVHVANGAAPGDHALSRSADKRGVWEVDVAGAKAGDRYGYRIDGADPLPDPVSRYQPDGVHALSQVVDPDAFKWTDDAWHGLSLADFVLYEIHIGTFTPEGTFDAARTRLPALAELGITAVELMPVASFPGKRNWGYDGVQLYAPQANYGDPDAMRRFADAAHALGMAVVLDVVYNHVGPEGNYLDRYGPYHTDVYRTPWGRALNYDGRGSDAVRRWAHDNALYWIAEYHVDALRLDAVQGIYDFGAVSFLEELSDDVHALGRQAGRKIQLMAESDLNDPRLVQTPAEGGFGLDAQWADDVHHVIHTTITGERHAYYQDFYNVATMADVYREPFFYARRYSPHRDRMHGRSPAAVPRKRFVVFAQNHDQVANRPDSDRLSASASPERLRLSAALVLLSPYLPLLFMGEEYGETAPFNYFVDHSDPDIIAAVRAGRSRDHDAPHRRGAPLDPSSEEAFTASRIHWELRDAGGHAQLLALYRDLLALRREETALRPGNSDARVQGTAEWMTVVRVLPAADNGASRPPGDVLCVFNLFDQALDIPVPSDATGRWTLRFSTDAEGYGGGGMVVEQIADGEPVTTDAPKRLIESSPNAPGGRTVRLPAWSAVVYVRGGDEARS